MKIAIATEGDSVATHFGRCPYYTVIEIENGEVKNKTILENPGHEPGRLPKFLSEEGVNQIIAGGMGRRAQMLFEQMGISWVLGITGTIEETIESICNDTICEGESLCSSDHDHEHNSGSHCNN